MRIIKHRTEQINIRAKPEVKKGIEEICIDKQITTTDFIEGVLEREIILHRESKESDKQEKASPSANSAPEQKQ
ncbi:MULTISPECIES: hypothetical protein [Pseudomonas]|jgi:hypothetical protein|uniref:hypothetical protein n=1 Tax=Pseudomonas TaxID=286 RepID=UPI0015E3E89E|nr:MULTISPECIES: hypothetical protein [Pseudomonas]MBA1302744.1 hypothetical protein [Pseudomonas carnis]MBJ2202958.1 hypothetical protein [Pseudomonas carnis]MBW9243979.1 hypothetical protein [Pseudomonas paracarnis]ULN82679.1 hypothetical protein HXW87_10995 [Pseudomonas sp. Y5-11]